MSAFLVSKEHLNFIITWAIDNGIENISPQKWFQEFYLENLRSLKDRYPDDYQEIIYWKLAENRYTHNPDAIALPVLEKEIAIAAVKLILCWEYQSCEGDYDKDSSPWLAMKQIKDLALATAGYESPAGEEELTQCSQIYKPAPWEYCSDEWRVFLNKVLFGKMMKIAS